MKTHVEVKDADEAKAIRTALADPETRALVMVLGTLFPLPSKASRKRVLEFIVDMFAEQESQDDLSR